jgi:hypothetical protein
LGGRPAWPSGCGSEYHANIDMTCVNGYT